MIGNPCRFFLNIFPLFLLFSCEYGNKSAMLKTISLKASVNDMIHFMFSLASISHFAICMFPNQGIKNDGHSWQILISISDINLVDSVGTKNFQFHSNSARWHEANQVCMEEGGRLASLEDPKDGETVKERFGHHLLFWLGASKSKILTSSYVIITDEKKEKIWKGIL